MTDRAAPIAQTKAALRGRPRRVEASLARQLLLALVEATTPAKPEKTERWHREFPEMDFSYLTGGGGSWAQPPASFNRCTGRGCSMCRRKVPSLGTAAVQKKGATK